MADSTIKVDEQSIGFSITSNREPFFIADIQPLTVKILPQDIGEVLPAILEIIEIAPNTPGMLFPLIVSQEVIGVLGLWGGSLEEEDLGALAIFAEHVAISIEKSRLLETTQELATTDPLTGIHNRRYLFDLGEQEIQRAKRIEHPLSAMMLDLDHFKRINDTYGHAFGDQVLREVAARCGKSIREIDIIGRYGGEEFAIVLPHADPESASAVAGRLKDVISDTPIDTEKGPISMTISIGIAEWTPDVEDLATLLDRADTALYAAKNTGRNRIVTYPPPPEAIADRGL
jgi:diguanylate cyclase (GGDEF)-like protein